MMRPKAIACLLLLLSHLVWSCSTYKPIEEVTIPSNHALSHSESLWRQLAYLKQGDLLSVTLDNEQEHELVFKSVTRDTLYATFQKTKSEILIKIDLDRIQGAKVEKFNLAFTLVGLALLTVASFIIISEAFSSMEFTM